MGLKKASLLARTGLRERHPGETVTAPRQGLEAL